MNSKEIEKKIPALIGFEELGFYEHKNWDRNYYFHKNTSEAVYEIWYELFPKVGVEELAFNWPIRYAIIFPKVNRILMNVMNKGNYKSSFGSLIQPELYDGTLSDLNTNYILLGEAEEKDRVPNFLEKGIYYEDRLIKSCIQYKQHVEQFALPFFEKFTTLQQVNDEIIDTIPWENLSSRIKGNTPFKRMIIMKLCNNPAYREFADMFKERIKGVIEDGSKEYKSYYEALIALDDYLESGKYLNAENEPVQRSASAIVAVPALPPLPENSVLEEQLVRQKEVLANIGITFSDQFSLDDYRRDANWESWGMETMEDNDLLYYLLLFAGTTVLNPVSNDYEPVSPNVYYFNAETDGFVNYGEIIDRLNLLTHNALSFTEVVGRFDQEYVGVSFLYKGVEYQWPFEYLDDWTDMSIMRKFIRLTKPDLTNAFYILEEGQGGLIFYFTEEQKHAIEQTFPGKKLIPLEKYH